MKNRHWLDFAEYVSLVGIGAGTVMSVLSKQFLYASTPLSFAMLVGFANRRRIESVQEQQQTTAQAELKQKITREIEVLNQHLQTLPSPEMIGDVRKSILRHNREEMKRLAAQVNTVQEDVVNHLKLLEGQNLGSVRDEIRSLENTYSELYSGLTNLRAHINQLANSSRVDELEKAIAQISTDSKQLQTTLQSMSDQTKPSLSYLQEQVNYLSRQMKSLPPPVDASSIKRELAELVSVVADLVPKRDLNSVVTDVRALQQQQESHTQADTLLKRQIQDIQQRLQAVPDVPQFHAQIEELLERKLRAVNQQLRTLPNTTQFQAQMRATLQQELEQINQQIQAQPNRSYELIFDLHTDAPVRGAIAGSRQALEEALDAAEQRLILICPWSSQSNFDQALARKLEALLRRNCQLDVGWCHLTNPQTKRYLSTINRRWAINPLGHQALQTTLKLLLKLKRQYPQQFRFKVMGTVENFLVADQQLAVLGIENRLKVATLFDDLELKLRTTDPAVIRQLTHRFDHPALADDDVEAFWNRAVTQYDLGDRASALADLDRIIAVNPDDAAAYNMRGVIHYDRQDAAGAIADFSRAIELNPNRGDAFCNRGFIHSEMGDQYGAIADFSLAIEANPASAIAYFYRGLACQKLDDHDGAISDYSHALHHAPDSSVVLYHRGIAYQNTQNYEGAIEDLEQAASLFRDAGHATNVRRAMQQLALVIEKAAEAEMAELPEADGDMAGDVDTDERTDTSNEGMDMAAVTLHASAWQTSAATNGGGHPPAAEPDTLASFFSDAPDPFPTDITADREEEPFLESDAGAMAEDDAPWAEDWDAALAAAQALDAEAQGLDSEAQELNSEAQELNSEVQELDFNAQALDFEAQELNSEVQEFDSNAQALDFDTQASDSEAQALDSEAQELDFDIQASDSEAQALDFNVQGLDSEAQELDSEASISIAFGAIAQPDTDSLPAVDAPTEVDTVKQLEEAIYEYEQTIAPPLSTAETDQAEADPAVADPVAADLLDALGTDFDGNQEVSDSADMGLDEIFSNIEGIDNLDDLDDIDIEDLDIGDLDIGDLDIEDVDIEDLDIGIEMDADMDDLDTRDDNVNGSGDTEVVNDTDSASEGDRVVPVNESPDESPDDSIDEFIYDFTDDSIGESTDGPAPDRDTRDAYDPDTNGAGNASDPGNGAIAASLEDIPSDESEDEFVAPSYLASLGTEAGADTIPIDPPQEHPHSYAPAASSDSGVENPPLPTEVDVIPPPILQGEPAGAIAAEHVEQIGTQTLADFFEVINSDFDPESETVLAPASPDAADGSPIRPSDTLENLRLQLSIATDDDEPPSSLGDLFIGAPSRSAQPDPNLGPQATEDTGHAPSEQAVIPQMSFSIPPSPHQGRSPEMPSHEAESFAEFCRRFSL